MQIDIDRLHINKDDKNELKRLLSEPQDDRSDLEQMWFLMDKIWDEYNCDNINLDWNKIKQFYAHPVWLLNGLYIEQDEISMRHRGLISDWVINNNFSSLRYQLPEYL